MTDTATHTWSMDALPEPGTRMGDHVLAVVRPRAGRVYGRAYATAELTWDFTCPSCGDRFRYRTGIRGVRLVKECRRCFWTGPASERHHRRPSLDLAFETAFARFGESGLTFFVWRGEERLTWNGEPLTQTMLRHAVTFDGAPEGRRLTAMDTIGWRHPIRAVTAAARAGGPPAPPSLADIGRLVEDLRLRLERLELAIAAKGEDDGVS